jgi:hypothetical protein
MKQACTGLFTKVDESSMQRSMRPKQNKPFRMKSTVTLYFSANVTIPDNLLTILSIENSPDKLF